MVIFGAPSRSGSATGGAAARYAKRERALSRSFRHLFAAQRLREDLASLLAQAVVGGLAELRVRPDRAPSTTKLAHVLTVSRVASCSNRP
jgi:hypothetical protein